MPEENKTIEELSAKMGEKNPDFVRDFMTPYYIEFETLRISQGKIIEAVVKRKQYRRKET